jgi:hypothetical protein
VKIFSNLATAVVAKRRVCEISKVEKNPESRRLSAILISSEKG